MELLEVFKDFQVLIRGKLYHSKYDALYEVVPKPNPKVVTLEDLKRYVENLQKRYPDHGFKLDRVVVNGRELYVVTRKSALKMPDGSRKKVRDRIPIYVDLVSQKFYVPKTYVKRQYKLTCYIIMRTLGALGVSTVKYISTV